MGNQVELYQSQDGINLTIQFANKTVWLSQEQLAVLFERDQSVISKHIKNVFLEGELDKESNMQKMHIANSDMGQLLPDPPTAAYLPQAGGQGAKESQYDGPTDLAVFYQLL
jgi:hypothetical protein